MKKILFNKFFALGIGIIFILYTSFLEFPSIYAPFLSTIINTSANTNPQLFSAYALSMDLKTKKILFSKNGEEKSYPASLTKILTAILLLENVKSDEKIVMTKTALQQPDGEKSTVMTFSKGETFSRVDALTIMMMLSANEVAEAIGEHIAGSKEAFGKLMTKRAKELGATQSNFVNASGVFDENHYTTAKDMALIMTKAFTFPEIVKAMSNRDYFATTSMQSQEIKSNNIMFSVSNFICGKPGYTKQSNASLLLVNTIHNRPVIHVLLDSNNPKYITDVKLLTKYLSQQIN